MKQSWKKQFAIIYAGQAFSLLGSAAVQFAIIWWLTIQTESAVTLTVASIVSFLPNMLIGPFAGVWIDRYNRRTVMIAADGLVALSSVILGIAFLLWASPQVWFIYLILFLRGLGNTFHGPAMQAALPTFVPAEMLTKTGGWANLISSAVNMLGPVLGAALMACLPVASIMLVDILGAAFAIICLLFIRIPDVPQAAERPLLSDLKLGFSAMRENRPFMAAFFPMILVTALYMPLGALFPLLVRTHFMGGAWHNSIVEAVFSGGLLAASAIMGVWGGMKKRFLMVALADFVLGVTCLVSGALPETGFWVFAVCCLFMGATGTFLSVPIVAYMQESFAPEVMGKVFSLWFTIASLAMPIGLLIAGPVSDAVGIDKWFFWSGAAIMAAAVLFYLRTRPYDTVARASSPAE